MNLQELQKQIMSTTLKPIYVFTGIELGIMDAYVDKIAESLNTSAIRLESTQEVYNQLSKPRLQKTSRLYLIRDDKEFSSNEKLWDIIERSASKYSDVVIYIYTSIDKRSKLYKQKQELIVEFEKVSDSILSGYVLNHLPKLNSIYVESLLIICDRDYARILLEIDKVQQYLQSGIVRDVNEAFEELIESNAFNVPVGDITFKLTDAILTRDHNSIQRYVVQAKRINEPEIRLLSILYNGFRQILLVQGCGQDKSNLTAKTGLTPYQVKLAREKEGWYSIAELINCLKVIRDIESGIKRGTIDIETSIDYLLLKIIPQN